LTGNQTGAILIYYLLSEKKKLNLLPKEGVVFKTIVTSDLGAKIARSYGFDVIETLTGFKYIGEQARFLESTDKTFLFGYEESYGYVIKDFVRDKDSLQAMLLAVEAAQFYLENDHKSLLDVLNDIYKQYGVYQETLHNIDLFGDEGAKRINRIVEHFRVHPLREVASRSVIVFEDYLYSYRIEEGYKRVLEFDKTNAVKYILDDQSWFMLRPSGTEPKLKIYIGTQAKTLESAKATIQVLSEALLSMVETIL
jgi:phosphoglucomutase